MSENKKSIEETRDETSLIDTCTMPSSTNLLTPAQQREIAPQEKNFSYEKTISSCRQKIYEKVQEADMLQTKLEELDASDKHLKDELERALKKEEVTVQSETSTALSDSTEMEASRSMEVEGLGGKEEKFCMTCATPPEPFCHLGLCWQKRMVQSKQAGAVFLPSDLLDILDMNSAP